MSAGGVASGSGAAGGIPMESSGHFLSGFQKLNSDSPECDFEVEVMQRRRRVTPHGAAARRSATSPDAYRRTVQVWNQREHKVDHTALAFGYAKAGERSTPSPLPGYRTPKVPAYLHPKKNRPVVLLRHGVLATTCKCQSDPTGSSSASEN